MSQRADLTAPHNPGACCLRAPAVRGRRKEEYNERQADRASGVAVVGGLMDGAGARGRGIDAWRLAAATRSVGLGRDCARLACAGGGRDLQWLAGLPSCPLCHCHMRGSRKTTRALDRLWPQSSCRVAPPSVAFMVAVWRSWAQRHRWTPRQVGHVIPLFPPGKPMSRHLWSASPRTVHAHQ